MSDQDRIRILFVVGALEPGGDGIGDYTRRLAAACIPLGVEVRLLALNDRGLSSVWRGKQPEGTISLECLRLPSCIDWKTRLEAAKAYIDDFDPQWISLHFVCFAFHPRGFVGDFATRLSSVVGARRLHVMVHEAWIGIAADTPWRHRLIGKIQRWHILKMLRLLKPDVVHTQASVHVELLHRSNFPKCQRLPLFSNLPIEPPNDDAALEILASAGLRISAEDRARNWLFCHFGSVAPEIEGDRLFAAIDDACQRRSRRAIIVFAGKPSAGGERVIARLKAEHQSRFPIVTTGLLSSAQVSRLLHYCDFGFTGCPPELTEKSSAVTTLLAHGLPVLVARAALRWPFRSALWKPHPGLVLLERLDDFPSARRLTGQIPTAEAVAAHFAHDLGIKPMRAANT